MTDARSQSPEKLGQLAERMMSSGRSEKKKTGSRKAGSKGDALFFLLPASSGPAHKGAGGRPVEVDDEAAAGSV